MTGSTRQLAVVTHEPSVEAALYIVLEFASRSVALVVFQGREVEKCSLGMAWKQGCFVNQGSSLNPFEVHEATAFVGSIEGCERRTLKGLTASGVQERQWTQSPNWTRHRQRSLGCGTVGSPGHRSAVGVLEIGHKRWMMGNGLRRILQQTWKCCTFLDCFCIKTRRIWSLRSGLFGLPSSCCSTVHKKLSKLMI